MLNDGEQHNPPIKVVEKPHLTIAETAEEIITWRKRG